MTLLWTSWTLIYRCFLSQGREVMIDRSNFYRVTAIFGCGCCGWTSASRCFRVILFIIICVFWSLSTYLGFCWRFRPGCPGSLLRRSRCLSLKTRGPFTFLCLFRQWSWRSPLRPAWIIGLALSSLRFCPLISCSVESLACFQSRVLPQLHWRFCSRIAPEVSCVVWGRDAASMPVSPLCGREA